ncbi:MAG: hypothetical protein JW990_20755 [Thermoleophilia bacterium]|nr:hypothetical protein [Thermoleophilia bacterium]
MQSSGAEVGGTQNIFCLAAAVHADLDTLCTVVYRTSDDLSPERRKNATRQTTDAQIVILAVAQMLGHPL